MPGLPRSVGLRPVACRLASAPFLPNGALTMHPSAACQVQSRPISPSYARSSTAQARSSAPVSTHSVKRSWTVDLGPNSRGSCDHWLPVRASQISPSKIARSSRRGRPGFLRGLSTAQDRLQQRPQRVVDPPDGRVVLLGGRRRGGQCGVSMPPALPPRPTFRIACKRVSEKGSFGQAGEHQGAHGEVDPGLLGGGQGLVILARRR